MPAGFQNLDAALTIASQKAVAQARARRRARIDAGFAAAGGAAVGALAQDNAYGTAAGLVSQVPHPAAQVAAVALSVLSHFEAKSEARDAKRQQTATEIKNARVVDDPNIKIAYGTCLVNGNRAFTHLADDIPALPSQTAGSVIGRFIVDDGTEAFDDAHDGFNNEFLLMQVVLSAGDIGELKNVYLNEYATKYYGGFALEQFNRLALTSKDAVGVSKIVLKTYGVASALATAFASDKRDATAKYTGLSVVDVFCQKPNSESYLHKRAVFDRSYGPFPKGQYWIDGRKLRSIDATGFSAAETWTPNGVLVIADYLTHDQYGPELADSRIHPASWALASGPTRGGEVWLGDGETLSARSVPPWMGVTSGPRTYAVELGRKGWKVGDNGLFPSEITGLNPHGRKFLRSEYDGWIETGLDFYAALDQLVFNVPGLILYWDYNGKIRASMVDCWTDRQAQSEFTLDNNVRPEGSYCDVVDPDAERRPSQVQITANISNFGFKARTLIWPMPGTPEAQALLRRLGGRVHELELRAPGVMTSLQGLTLAASVCAWLNRRKIVDRMLWGFPFSGKEAAATTEIMEPGSVGTFIDPIKGHNIIGRVDSVDVDYANLVVEIGATEFYPSDFVPRIPVLDQSVERKNRDTFNETDTGDRLGVVVRLKRGAYFVEPGSVNRLEWELELGDVTQGVSITDIKWTFHNAPDLFTFSDPVLDATGANAVVMMTVDAAATLGAHNIDVDVAWKQSVTRADWESPEGEFDVEYTLDREAADGVVGGRPEFVVDNHTSTDPLSVEWYVFGDLLVQGWARSSSAAAITYAWSSDEGMLTAYPAGAVGATTTEVIVPESGFQPSDKMYLKVTQGAVSADAYSGTSGDIEIGRPMGDAGFFPPEREWEVA